MSDPIHCPDCGAELPTGLPLGLCSRCALKGALDLSAEEVSGSAFRVSGLPRSFGDYELLEEIARGGMGVVYKARQASLNRVVALKMILAGNLARPEDVRRFRAEAKAAASLQHSNIVAIHEVGEHEGHHYFSMDLVEGANLANLLRDGPLPARRSASYVKTIAEAIHFAHTCGILHRDLKPSNVLIDSNDQPRVTDFGLARNLANDSDLTVTGQVHGSPSFMPPEQASGQREKVGVPSDVYSLGAILYHALTGRPPFAGESVADTLKQVENTEPVAPRFLNPSVPRDLETICLKCLQKESGKRYSSAQELADELDRVLRDEPIHAHPVSGPEKLWRWCRRNPVIATLTASVLLTASIGLMGWLIAKERAQTARQAEVKRLEILYASDSFLASQALQDTNVQSAPDLLRGLQAAIDRWSTNAALWRSKAVVLKRTGALEDALAYISKAIELTSTTGENLLLTEMLFFRRDLLRDMSRGAEAGMDERRAIGLPYQHIPTNELPDYQRASQVSVEFGATNRESGLYVVEIRNGNHRAWNSASFFVDPTFKWKLGSDVVVRAEYQALGHNPIGVHYDGDTGPYSSLAEIQREYTDPEGSWRVIEVRARDARFQNSQKGHADFRIYESEMGFILRRITVTRYPGRRMPPRDPSTSSNLVDLTAFYNGSLRLYMPGGDPYAATNVLRLIRQTTGVDFDARGVAGFWGTWGTGATGTNTTPESIAGIPIGRRLSGLHFLHAANSAEKDGRHIGSYVMHMSDGSHHEFEIVYGRNVRSARGDYRNVAEAEVAWDGRGISAPDGTRVRIFKVTWINPDPAVGVTSVDIVTARSKCALHLLAITIEP